MFKLQKIWGHNFWLFKDFELDFSLLPDDAIIFVQGFNHDATDATSNYSGKTTLLIDFFRWVCEDKYPRLRGVNDVVGKFDSYTAGGIEYIDRNRNILKINRYRKHKKFGSCIRIKWQGQTLNTERAIEAIELFHRVVGLTPAQFISGTLFTNNHEEELLLKIPSARNKELADIWGINSFDEAAKIASKLCNDIDKHVAEINVKLDMLKKMRIKLKSNIEIYKKDLSEHERKISTAIRSINSKIQELRDLVNKGKKLLDIEAEMKNKIVLTKDSITAANKRYKKFSRMNKHISKLRDKFMKYELRYKNRCRMIKDIEHEIAHVLISTKTGTLCKYCGNVISNKRKVILIKPEKEKLNRLKESIPKLCKRMNEYGEVLKDKKKLLASYKIDSIKNEIDKLLDELNKQQEILNENRSNIHKLQSLDKEINKLKKDRCDLKEADNYQFANRIKIEKNELDKTRFEIRTLKSDKIRMVEEFTIYKAWSGSNGFRRLRNFVLTEKVEMMSEEFNTHLYKITDGAITGNWSVLENGDIVCTLFDNTDGGEKHFKGFSWAQRTKILTAQALASSRIYAPHIGHINIDEKLDAGIDIVGLERLLHYIREFSSLGKRVFLTSHLADVKNYCDVVLSVTRQNNEAVAKLEKESE